MARFAYLFLAHRDVPVLQAAIDCIDDPRNDVFIHWDLKASEDVSTLHAKYSHIYFTERTRCYWGDEQKALYLLLELAHSKGDYLYYHLMTAEEMPIKTQDQIHAFYEANPTHPIYLHINVGTFKSIQDRCRFYYPFIDNDHFKGSKALKTLSLILGKSERLVGVDRRKKHPDLFPLYNGWGWGSIPGDFAAYAISKKAEVMDAFKKTLAGDEVFMHSLAMHSPEFAPRMYGYDGTDNPIHASRLLQDWKRGKPYAFTKEDYEMIVNDPTAFFVRKISSAKDPDLYRMIRSHLVDNHGNPSPRHQ
jgi:hypothetical protein